MVDLTVFGSACVWVSVLSLGLGLRLFGYGVQFAVQFNYTSCLLIFYNIKKTSVSEVI